MMEIRDNAARKPMHMMTDAELRALPIISGGDAAADAAAAEAKAAADAAAGNKDAAYCQAEAKKAFDAREKVKETSKAQEAEIVRLKAIEEEHGKLKQSQMTEQEKVNARLKELEPYETEVKTSREHFQKLLDLETEGLSDDMKAVIPGLSTAAEKLLWVRDAKAKGLFGGAVPAIGARKPGGGGGNTILRSDYAKLPLKEFEITRDKIKKGELVLVDG